MSVGLFSGVSGLALGTGLYKNVSGLWGGAAGLIDGSGGGSPFGGASLYLDFLTGAPLDSRITFTRSTTATFVGSNGLIQSAAINEPRFDYDPVTLAAKGLLIEEQRANLLTYSEDFSNVIWTKTGSTVTSNATVSPDGLTTADKAVEDTSTGTHNVFNAGAGAAGAHTFSVWAKAAGRNWIVVRIEGVDTYFNLSNGTIGTIGAGITASIQAFSNSWYRCAVTKTLAGAVACTYRLATDNNVSSYTGDGTSGVFLWGAQLEAGAFATSYIPTVASQVTRSADVATMTGTNFSSWYNQTEGTFVADGSLPTISVAFPNFYTVSTGLGTNRITQGTTSASPTLTVVSGGVMQVSLPSGFPPSTTPFKVASSYKLDDFASCLSGGTVVTDTSGILPIGVDRIAIGTNATTTGAFANGHIRQLAYFNTRLSDAQLQELTAPPLVTTLSLDFTNGIYDA